MMVREPNHHQAFGCWAGGGHPWHGFWALPACALLQQLMCCPLGQLAQERKHGAADAALVQAPCCASHWLLPKKLPRNLVAEAGMPLAPPRLRLGECRAPEREQHLPHLNYHSGNVCFPQPLGGCSFCCLATAQGKGGHGKLVGVSLSQPDLHMANVMAAASMVSMPPASTPVHWAWAFNSTWPDTTPSSLISIIVHSYCWPLLTKIHQPVSKVSGADAMLNCHWPWVIRTR
ncbi:hypothetical protein V8C86DRAFT_18069 [Haematococcus lacustris]